MRMGMTLADRIRPLNLGPLDDQPLVSVLIANYNYADHVGTAIQSVLDQSYANHEVIVCDDGSTDGSPDVIERYCRQDSRVRLVQLPENRGMAAATNAAFAESSGEIICLLDSDDYFAPTKLEQVVAHFRRGPNTGLIVHPLLVIRGDAGEPVQQIPFLTRFEHGWIAKPVIERGGRWRDMPTSALCLRREVAELTFPIPEPEFRRAADGFIFTLAPLCTEVAAIEEPLAMYRVHDRNDHAALGLGTRAVESDERFIRIQSEQVNARLNELIGCSNLLDVARHLVYQQKVLLLGLFEGKPRGELLRQYSRVARLLWKDDLYTRQQKLFGYLVYGLAIPMPGILRNRWLSITLGYSPIKQRLQRILRPAPVAHGGTDDGD